MNLYYDFQINQILIDLFHNIINFFFAKLKFNNIKIILNFIMKTMILYNKSLIKNIEILNMIY